MTHFFSDLRSDVAATAKYTSWIPAAIVEELEIHSPIQLNSLEESKICDETVEEKNHMLIPDHPYRYSFLEVESSGHSEFPQSKYASQKMSTTWGSFFLHENENYVSELGHRVISRGSLAEESVDATYWNHYIREHCASSLAIPCLSILESLDLDTAFEWEKGTDFCFHIRQANDI